MKSPPFSKDSLAATALNLRTVAGKAAASALIPRSAGRDLLNATRVRAWSHGCTRGVRPFQRRDRAAGDRSPRNAEVAQPARVAAHASPPPAALGPRLAARHRRHRP